MVRKKMKHDLTTGTWQDDTGCPISIILVSTSDEYRPNIPVQFQLDELYAEPSAEVWAKVKKEKIDRSEFRAQQKADKSVNDKERIESLAVYDGEGKA